MSSPPDQASGPQLASWLDRLAGKRLVVWGDVVADRFLHGTTTRVSREAPALVMRYEGEEVRPGGAGNAALNAASLGAKVSLCGYIGDDANGSRLRRRFTDAGIETSGLLRRDDAGTPVKTRVMAGGTHTVRQQILRIDADSPWPASDATALIAALGTELAEADALLISDYGLGSVSPQAFEALQALPDWSRLPVALDCRFDLLRYRGVTIATPNEQEVEEALGLDLEGDALKLESAGRELLQRLQCDTVIITRGSCGMSIFRKDQATCELPIHGTDEIADVTGAGDTVIAALTLAVAAGADVLEAASLANVAAGLVVMKHGTATVQREELADALRVPR